VNIKNEKKIQIRILLVCFIVFGALFLFARSYSSEGGRMDLYFEHGRVINVINETTDPFHHQVLEVEIQSGELEGINVQAENNLMDHTVRAFDEGERVIVQLSDQFIQISSPERGSFLIFFVALFLILLCLIGGKRGVRSVVGLVFSLASIVFILVPLTLAGYPAILVAISIGTLITITDITLLAGFNPKSISAIFGCISGVLIAAVFALIAGHFAFISGYHTEHAGSLLAWETGMSLSGIFISGVIISAMGAINDTSISIASAMEEIKLASPTISTVKLAKAGLNVGRDIMGTMSNTLILAFVGSSISLLLLTISTNVTWIEFINDSEIGIEIIQGVAGSIGVVLTAPMTAFIAAKLLSKSKVDGSIINNE